MYGATLSHKVTNLTSADLGLLRAYAAAETSPNWTYERLYWDHLFRNFDSIRNLKAWLMELTSNLCKDIINERSRGPAAIENIEWVGDTGLICTVSSVADPQMVLEMEERYVQIRRAVASLPQRLRDTFILHYYEGLKHAEIAERQGISYDIFYDRCERCRSGISIESLPIQKRQSDFRRIGPTILENACTIAE